MIAVIADDLSGATELAGIGWRQGLKSHVVRGFAMPSALCRPGALTGPPEAAPELLVLDTDSRSCPPAEAAARIEKAAVLLLTLKPRLVYKKVDSVLRGNVLVEVETLTRALGRKRVLLVPCNPGRGRTIERGHYFIQGCPIHETDFRNDPEFPITSPSVLDMLGSSTTPSVVGANATLPLHGVVVGEASAEDDLKHWSRYVDKTTLPAGGAEFFEAVLERFLNTGRKRTTDQVPLDSRTNLFICGSASISTSNFIARSRRAGVAVVPMPSAKAPDDAATPSDIAEWAAAICAKLFSTKRVFVSIERPLVRDKRVSEKLATAVAEVVCKVISGAPPLHIFAEGGATASQVAVRLGWKRFHVVRELAPGVVTMGIAGEPHTFTVKPGSYEWPIFLQPDNLTP